MKWLMALFLVIWAVPATLPAGIVVKNNTQAHEATWKNFNDAVDDKIKEIKGVVFGPVVRILGVLGIAYGVCCLAMGKTQQMMTYAGIGLLLNLIPFFIDSVFSAMLPGM